MTKLQKLNIIDENDNIIGEDSRENIHKKGLLHREIHVWIYNKKAEILFQKRSMAKDTCPGLLDASVGGHVELNDNYSEAAIRELEEETDIKADKNDLTYITKIRKKTYDKITGMTNNVIRVVYAYEHDNKQEIKLEKNKADSLEFWSLEKIFNVFEEDRKKFIPTMLSKEYINIYKKIQELIKGWNINMKIIKYPQSCFLIEYNEINILIDLGTYVFDLMDITPKDFTNIDIVLLTHEHSDHTYLEALKQIYQNNQCPVICNKPVHDILQKESIPSEILEYNEIKEIKGIKIKWIESIHGDLPSGNPKPEVLGFLIDNKIYHPGDTIYLEEKPYADVVFVPICGTVVMDFSQAVKFTKEINPKLAIPMHYDSPNYSRDTKSFIESMKDSSIEVRVLGFGESYNF